MNEEITKALEPLFTIIEDRLRNIVYSVVKEALLDFHKQEKPKKMFTRDEVCAMLHITKPTLWNLTKEGFIEQTKLGRKVLYTEESVNEYLKYGKISFEIKQKKKSIEKMNREKKTYIMIDDITKKYKIGYSVNPKYREGTLQSEKPSIHLLYYSPLFVEQQIHKEYASKRIRGEWFDLTEDDIKNIVEKYNFVKNEEN